jgi:hypothetical protein
MPKRSERFLATASGDDSPKNLGNGEGRRHGVKK